MNVLNDLFIAVLSMSITASYVAAGVILVRLALRKAPKLFSYALWAVVLFRLVCPLSFSSPFSLLGLINPDAQNSVGVVEYVPKNTGLMQTPVVQSDIVSIDNTVNASLPPVVPTASVNPMQVWLIALSLIWLAGILALLLYSVVSYLKIKRRLQTATLVKDNIFESDQIGTVFVLGFVRPKIYVPAGVGSKDLPYILEHEGTHIRRRDYLIKPLAFLALLIHWFNPLMWLSFMLMSRDMEMSCDESVLQRIGKDTKGDYSGSLLSLSVKRTKRLLTVNPLAFGESHLKARIKNVLSYKKPAFWVIVVALMSVVGVGIVLAANPAKVNIYHNETLGFSLKFPREWTGRYTIKESQNSIAVYSKKVADQYDHAGRLFTIERQVGELITEEDMNQAPVGQRILLQGNGYTYFLIAVSDVQYPPDDQKLSSEYKALSKQIPDVYQSIALLGDQKPQAKEEGFKVVGTSFFTMEIPGHWEIKAEGVLYWVMYDGNTPVGAIQMIPYKSEGPGDADSADDNTLTEYFFNDEGRREVKVSFHLKNVDRDITEKIKNSFNFVNGIFSPFTVIDLLSAAEQYIWGGGKKIFGKIDSFEIENGKPVAVNVRVMDFILDDEGPNGFRIEDPNQIKTFPSDFVSIAPLAAPNYNTYGTYEIPNIDESFLENYRNYRDFYYDFIIGADGQLKIIAGHYIP